MEVSKIMLDMKKCYESALKEDAVVGGDAGGASVGGEISAPSLDNGISAGDVLGKDTDHHKDGYLGKGDFHVPTNVLGKGCVLKRMEIPSKKKKDYKNPYAKGAVMLTDSEKHFTDISKILDKMDSNEIIKQMKASYPAFGSDIDDVESVFLCVRDSLADGEPILFIKVKSENDVFFIHSNIDNGKIVVKDGTMFKPKDAYKEYQALKCPKDGKIIWSR